MVKHFICSLKEEKHRYFRKIMKQ